MICGGFLFILLTSCGSERIDSQDVVAQVNEAVVTNAELENAITPTTSPDVRLALKRKLMEKWVEDEIFYQAATEEGLALTKGELFLLENEGLKVYYTGTGRVVKQSQSPGSKALKGSSIKLELSL